MIFTAALIITSGYWFLVGALALGMLWLIIRIARELWSFRFFRKVVKWSGIVTGALFILAVGTADPESPLGRHAPLLALVIFSPFILLVFIQVCFMVYHTLMHGDPFYDSSVYEEVGRNHKERSRGVITLDMYTHSRKKMCPICKRLTRCKVYDGRKGGIPYHIHRD